MTLQSTTIPVLKNIEELYNLLKGPGTYQKLMPEDTTFEVTEKGFAFQLKNMPRIALKLKQTRPTQITWVADGGNIPFKWIVHLQEQNTHQSQVYFVFEGDLNPMVQMMVKKPLKHLLEQMIENISKL